MFIHLNELVNELTQSIMLC